MTLWTGLLSLGMALIIIPWLIYPAVIQLLAGADSDPSPLDPFEEPGIVSVVIATRESPAAVLARLSDVVQGDWPAERLELVVAVDGDPVPFDFPGLSPAPGRLVVVSRGAGVGKAAALNAGAAAASGELIVFTDTAQRFAPDAIPTLVRAMGDLSFGAISGALELGNEQSPGSPIARYWQLERRLRAAEARLHSAIGVTGAIYVMRRALWQPLPHGLILDDLWIPMRLVLAGHRVGFCPNAVARDTRMTTAGQEFRRKVRTLTGNLQLVAWLPAILLPWRNPAWLQFLCHKLLRLLTPLALLCLGVGAVGSVFAFSTRTGAWVLGAGSGALTVGALLPGAVGRRVRGGIAWGAAMQGAIVVAAWNGVRGRWNVW